MSDTPQGSAATVLCECCKTLLPPGTRARIDRESGVIICDECFGDLTYA